MKLGYREFRTGLTYRDVYYLLWDRDRKGRHTVLGKWGEIKRAMYAQYLHEVDDEAVDCDGVVAGGADEPIVLAAKGDLQNRQLRELRGAA